MSGKVVTTGKAARILGVSVQYVQRLCDTGRLPAERGPLDMRLIPLAAVQDLAQRRGEAKERQLA